MKFLTIVGARPQFIKLAPLCKSLREYTSITHTILHTGQHFDKNMSDIFFEQLDIPAPTYNCSISGGTQSQQTSKMMVSIEDILLDEKPDMVIVFGDTNSTLAGALVASKLRIPIAHIESGLRSFDRNMPEEINRIITDHVSDYLFCSSNSSVVQLKKEGITTNVHNVGDIMMDSTQLFTQRSIDLCIFDTLAKKYSALLSPYYLLTIHRPSNTDSKKVLSSIFDSLKESPFPIIFPIHPRTAKQIKGYNIKLPNQVIPIPSQGYLEILSLITNSKLVITDSGGLQKEAFFLKKPGLVLRDTTEWTELIDLNVSTLCLNTPSIINDTLIKERLNTPPAIDWESLKMPFGNGNSAKKILAYLN